MIPGREFLEAMLRQRPVSGVAALEKVVRLGEVAGRR